MIGYCTGSVINAGFVISASHCFCKFGKSILFHLQGNSLTATASANLASQFFHFHSFFKFGKSILSLPQLLQIWQVNSLCITLLLQIWQVNSLTSTDSVNLASKFSHFHSFCKFGKSILSLPQLLKNLASQFSHFHCFCKFGKSILSLSPLYLQIW